MSNSTSVRFRFTIRGALMSVLLFALAFGWYRDHHRLQTKLAQADIDLAEAKELQNRQGLMHLLDIAQVKGDWDDDRRSFLQLCEHIRETGLMKVIHDDRRRLIEVILHESERHRPPTRYSDPLANVAMRGPDGGADLEPHGLQVERRWRSRSIYKIVEWHFANRHGQYLEFYSSGLPSVVGRYEGGRPVGNWAIWDKDGQLVAQVDLGKQH